MTRFRQGLLAMLLVALLVHPAWSCSHEGSSAVFTQSLGPDAPYSAYARGRLGVLQRTYYIRSLVVAYNTLSGRGLTPEEQKAAVEVDKYYNPEGYDAASQPDALEYVETRSFNGSEYVVDRAVGSDGFDSFTNCLGDAFQHANDRLAELYNTYGGAATAEIQDWIAAQNAVFSNCSGGHRRQYFSETKTPPDVPATMPKPAPANAPLWLKQERAYQTAAAEFYAMRYDDAVRDFRAIAADKASPSAPLARYLVARALLRKAALTPSPASSPGQPPPPQEEMNRRIIAYNAAMRRVLGEAREQLEGILRDRSMSAIHPQSQHLLDYTMLRLDPAAQAEELARRLTAAAKPGEDYRQNVIDLGYAMTATPEFLNPGYGLPKDGPPPESPLLRWIADMHTADPLDQDIYWPVTAYERSRGDAQREHDALAAWRTTRGQQWLVAALTFAEPGDEGIDELMAAARAVPPVSPAYASVTFQRLRLARAQGQAAHDGYREIAALMPQMERTQPRSTINAFLDDEAELAPTLEDFLKTAPRLPASYTDEDGFEDASPTPDYPSTDPSETLCGVPIAGPKAQHFDAATVTVLNQRLPVRLLRQAAMSAILPGNLRFQLAHMAWTRALLLEDAATVRTLAPYLSRCQPAMKEWLDRYAAAQTPEERHIAGLMAMMRFTSTEPMVRAGTERDFASYDDFRDNWWCSADESHITPAPKVTLLFSQPIVPMQADASGNRPVPSFGTPHAQADPPFLTAADRADAGREIAALEKIPSASDYFAQAALDWVKTYPKDARDADVVGFAMRVVRNGCRSDETAGLNHQLFDVLHSRFPNSEWAKRYTTWE
ncbi:MAG TPA: hypothetical protein VN612_08785 [Acidobacteriaceae bacterium]|nr:hypothetical protein [Acidobacteriaceae bacterium]